MDEIFRYNNGDSWFRVAIHSGYLQLRISTGKSKSPDELGDVRVRIGKVSTKYATASIWVSSCWKTGILCGLCGRYDGDISNDLTLAWSLQSIDIVDGMQYEWLMIVFVGCSARIHGLFKLHASRFFSKTTINAPN